MITGMTVPVTAAVAMHAVLPPLGLGEVGEVAMEVAALEEDGLEVLKMADEDQTLVITLVLEEEAVMVAEVEEGVRAAGLLAVVVEEDTSEHLLSGR